MERFFPLSQSQGTGRVLISLKHFSKFVYISINVINSPLLQSQFVLPGISTLFVEGSLQAISASGSCSTTFQRHFAVPLGSNTGACVQAPEPQCAKQPPGDAAEELWETHALPKLQQRARGATPGHSK